MKNIHFLAGLPRSGSTVLAGILNQHPEIHASATSGLLDMLVGTLRAWADSFSAQAAAIPKEESELEVQRILRTICDEKYSHIDKPIIIDKARSWASSINIPTMAKILGRKPKIIATVRNIPDCVASMVRIAKPDDVNHFLRTSELVSHIKESYQVLESGYQFAPECILFVDYDDLMDDPKKQLDRVHEFLGLSEHTYDFNNIDGSGLQERDEEIWLVKGLHNIQPILKRTNDIPAKQVLGHRFNEYVQPRFWLGETTTNLPIHDLDLQLAAGLIGNFEEGNRLGEKIAREEPWNERAAFNRGWYEMWKGNLVKGHEQMFRGRSEGVFGNEPPKSPMPMWDGKSKGTVLLNLEGGLGDQIHCVRFACDIVARGCQVIVACSGQLATLFREVEGVTAVIQHEAVFGVVHDFWAPSMSMPLLLNMEYKDVSGAAYISRPKIKNSSKMRIGLRWQGNPAFEHEQHRIFPPIPFFRALEDADAEFISLQKDLGSESRPPWVKEVPLGHWEETAQAIASCDLVITSCTSVAHLAGALGVPTWIIVPILPYYLWAKPGNTTEWYDSVRLFRQTVFGDWSKVFSEIKNNINSYAALEMSDINKN